MYGIYPMLYAFYNRDGTLDRGAHHAQVDACLQAGVHGVAVGGLASDCNKLSAGERSTLADWTLEKVGVRVPVSVTISGDNVKEILGAALKAKEGGASWIALQPPKSDLTSQTQLIDYFSTILKSVDISTAIQNAPEFFNASLNNKSLLTLAERFPNFSLLKAEGSSHYIAELMAETGDRFTVFNGRNGIELIDNLRLGCAGTIPGVECCDIQVRIYNEWQAGNHESAIALFKEVHPLLSYLMLSVDTLLCYGKRLAASRIGILDYFERDPGLSPTKEGMETMAFWSSNLESFERQ